MFYIVSQVEEEKATIALKKYNMNTTKSWTDDTLYSTFFKQNK